MRCAHENLAAAQSLSAERSAQRAAQVSNSLSGSLDGLVGRSLAGRVERSAFTRQHCTQQRQQQQQKAHCTRLRRGRACNSSERASDTPLSWRNLSLDTLKKKKKSIKRLLSLNGLNEDNYQDALEPKADT